MEEKHPNVGAISLCERGYQTQMKTQRGNFVNAVILGGNFFNFVFLFSSSKSVVILWCIMKIIVSCSCGMMS